MRRRRRVRNLIAFIVASREPSTQFFSWTQKSAKKAGLPVQLFSKIRTYMDSMVRVTLAFVVCCAASRSAQGQVVLQLSAGRFNAYEPIQVTVINQQSQPISVCVSQQWIPKPNDHVGVATTPLLFQRQNGRKWVTALNGVDIGPLLRFPVAIGPHNSQEFQFQANGNGKARFVLYYWKGENSNVCGNPSGRKRAVSPTFTLIPRQEQAAPRRGKRAPEQACVATQPHTS